MAARRLSNSKKGCALAIRVTPRANRNEVVEIMSDDTVKIRLTAPPVEGKANQALVKFLAKVLGVPNSGVEIVGGATSRDKLVSILDIDKDQAYARLLAQLKN